MKALRMFLWMTLLLGVAYPLLITLIAQTQMPHKANGSMIGNHGSRLIGQKFTREDYFWSRPSSVDYNPLPSGASNLGPISPALKKQVDERALLLSKHGKAPFPPDLLFASGSGLDPHISLEAAYFQIKRVAKSRGFDSSLIQALVNKHTKIPYFGKAYVPVLELNIELDEISARHTPRP